MNATNITTPVPPPPNEKPVVIGVIFIFSAMIVVALFAVFVHYCCKKMTLLHLCWFKCCKKHYTYEELNELKDVVYENQ